MIKNIIRAGKHNKKSANTILKELENAGHNIGINYYYKLASEVNKETLLERTINKKQNLLDSIKNKDFENKKYILNKLEEQITRLRSNTQQLFT